jgi:polysaccharide biosynthesis protein PslH
MRILFLSRWYPYPADNGSRIRIFNLLRGLARKHTITLVSFTQQEISAEHRAALEPYCAGISTVPYQPFRPNGLRARLGFLSLKPRSVIDTYSPQLAAIVAQQVRTGHFDLVIASQIDVAPYALAIPGVQTVLEELEITTIYEQAVRPPDAAARLRSSLTWAKHRLYVQQLLRKFNGCTVVSAAERTLVAGLAPAHTAISVIPNGVDSAACAEDYGPPAADSLIYAGSLTYGPNYDAVSYFLRDIFPYIRKERPTAHLTVTGSTTNVALEQLPAGDHWHLAGYLPDVRPAIARAQISVVPLRQGGGTRLKILESLALGTPVVATSKGAEGLELRHGEEIIIADHPAAFAEAVLALLRDPALRQRLSSAGRAAVAQRYDWSIINAQFDQFISAL